VNRYFITIILILAAATTVCSQVDTLTWKRSFWFDLGVGSGKKGLAINGGFNFEVKRNWVMSLRTEQIDETDDSGSASCPDKINSTGVSLLVGRLIKKKPAVFLISAGPSAINLHHNPCSNVVGDQYSEVSLGVLISGQAYITSRHFGVGISPFVSINDKRSFYGVTLNLAVGKFAH